ncbi:unnamed protein product [Closterium sp. NIES-54]
MDHVVQSLMAHMDHVVQSLMAHMDHVVQSLMPHPYSSPCVPPSLLLPSTAGDHSSSSVSGGTCTTWFCRHMVPTWFSPSCLHPSPFLAPLPIPSPGCIDSSSVSPGRPTRMRLDPDYYPLPLPLHHPLPLPLHHPLPLPLHHPLPLPLHHPLPLPLHHPLPLPLHHPTHQAASAAAVCLQADPNYRPLMDDVLQSLMSLCKPAISPPHPPPSLACPHPLPVSLHQAASVAAVCLQADPDYRPHMDDVVQSLMPLCKAAISPYASPAQSNHSSLR